jgi:hypothetical protein
MWTHACNKGPDTKWLAAALKMGTAVILSYRFYSKKRGPHVCGTGWAIACSRAKRVMKGSFYKFSQNASSYQGELLGLVAAHTLVLYTARHYHLTAVKGKIICDSQSALSKESIIQG